MFSLMNQIEKCHRDNMSSEEQGLEKKMLKFKRKALGLFGKRATKTFGELASLLYETKVIHSPKEEEAIKFIQGTEIVKYSDYKGLFFGYSDDRKKCKIEIYPCSLYME